MGAWRIAEGVAWVGDDRIALIDTRSAHAPPMIVPPVFAELWRELSAGPRSEEDLLAKGAELVDESASALVEAFVATFAEHELIEPAGVGA